MSHDPFVDNPYTLSLESQEQQLIDDEYRRWEVDRLATLAYSEPEKAAEEAKSLGLYMEMQDRMLEMHREWRAK